MTIKEFKENVKNPAAIAKFIVEGTPCYMGYGFICSNSRLDKLDMVTALSMVSDYTTEDDMRCLRLTTRYGELGIIFNKWSSSDMF